jgi:hypothetical protein
MFSILNEIENDIDIRIDSAFYSQRLPFARKGQVSMLNLLHSEFVDIFPVF